MLTSAGFLSTYSAPPAGASRTSRTTLDVGLFPKNQACSIQIAEGPRTSSLRRGLGKLAQKSREVWRLRCALPQLV